MKILVLLLGLAVVAGVAYYQVTGGSTPRAGAASQPKQTLDNVRRAAKNIEIEAQQRADSVGKSPAEH